MKRAALALSAIAALALPAAVASAQAKPASRPDLSGVWQMEEAQSTTFANTASGKAEAPPLTPQAAALLDARRAGMSADPTLQCMPMGLPRNMMTRLPIEVIQTRGQVVLMFATGLRARRIYTDGRKHDDDIDPTFNGESMPARRQAAGGPHDGGRSGDAVQALEHAQALPGDAGPEAYRLHLSGACETEPPMGLHRTAGRCGIPGPGALTFPP
jgi:hypothetical protein